MRGVPESTEAVKSNSSAAAGGKGWFGFGNGVGRAGGQKVVSLKHHLDELRLVKSDAEIKVMKRAGEITGKAFVEVCFWWWIQTRCLKNLTLIIDFR